jgi:Spy/CpxP family protein refolding chaperone
MRRITALTIGFILAGTGLLFAQAPPESPEPAPAPPARVAPPAQPAPPAPPADALFSMRGDLYPPELVMRHQKAIKLEPNQKQAIRDEIRQAELQFLDLKWEVQDAAESLRTLLEEERVDEERALALLGKILAVEEEIKRTQFTLMIRIKNILTPAQQKLLNELRPRGAPAPPSPGGI